MNDRGPLRILQACSSRSWGGMEMQVLRTTLALRRRGGAALELTVLCYPGSALQKAAAEEGVPVLALPFDRGFHPGEIRTLRRHLAGGRFHLVHTHFSRDLQFLVPALQGLSPRIPLVLTKHVGSFVRKKDIFHRYLYARVDLVTAISRVIRDNVIATCPVHPSRVQVLYSGVDLHRFAPSASERRRTREALGVRDDETLVGMVGRMSPGKGHAEFLRAASIVLAEANREPSRLPARPSARSPARFIVVGGASFGEERHAAEVEALREELDLGEGMIFTGFRHDTPALLAGMDVLAMPSHAEAFGNVAVEAMATELPVVASNCDGLLDIVVDGVTGLQVPPRDPQKLAAAMLRLVRDPALRRALGAAGRERASALFDEEKQAAALLRWYAHLTAPAPAHGGRNPPFGRRSSAAARGW